MTRIMSVLGWLGMALVFAGATPRLLGMATTFDISPEVDRYARYVVWTGAALILVYLVSQWREAVEYFRRRQARYGAVATLSVAVALGILIAVNYLSVRRNTRWDLTTNQHNSLSEQSIKVMRALQGPVKFIVFDSNVEFDRYRARLEQYDYENDNMSVEYVDPTTTPARAREYQIQANGTIVIEYMGRRQNATSDSEQDITNALIRVSSTRELTAYFVQGHGEKDPASADPRGYGAVGELLKRDNYKVEPLPLAQQKDVPADATVVVVAGPTNDFLPEEVEALRRYLARGGKLMVLLDPVIGTAKPPTALLALVEEWGINVGNNVVVDVTGATNDPSLAVALTYPSHPITEGLRTLTIFPLARSVQPASAAPSGRTAQPVVQTSARSWAESNLSAVANNEGVQPDPDQGDIAGPVTIGVAVSAPVSQPEAGEAAKPDDTAKPETRLVVLGDSDFAANEYGGAPGNQNLFANAVNWLAQQENLIAVRPRAAADRRLTMTEGQQQLVFYFSILVLPAIVFGAGIYTWRRRRG